MNTEIRFASRAHMKEWLEQQVPHYARNVRQLLEAQRDKRVSPFQARNIERWQFNDALAWARRNHLLEVKHEA